MPKRNCSTTIAIIGGGFSGSMVAAQLLRAATIPLNIKLIERNSLLGRGVAYGTSSPYHLLNVPAGQISALPNDPDHFLRWVKRQNVTVGTFVTSEVTANSFVPRKIYGAYVQSILDDAETTAPSYVHLERITDEAIAIEPANIGATLYLSNGQTIQADQIVLALGNFPPANPPIQDRSFYNSSRYKGNAYSADVLTDLDADDSVLLIGSGLTMVDLTLTLFQQGHRGKIYTVSRHGLLPLAHKTTPCISLISPFIAIDQAPKTVRVLMHLVRQQVQSAAACGQDWRVVLNSLRPITQSLWQTLPLSEKRRFLRHVRAYWDIHRHRIAPEVAEVINKLVSSGQLDVHAGRIQAYREDSCGVDVTVRKRHTTDDIVLRVNRVINCTGPASNYEKLTHPFVKSLLSQGLVCCDVLGMGLKTAASGALLDATGIASKFLYTLGPTRQGDLWETIAVPEIREQAMLLTQELLSSPPLETVRSSEQVSVKGMASLSGHQLVGIGFVRKSS
ncbi:hypothetical protein BZZ01_16210 [Nostocales cyanobacterium HT-58-2]|nr:hypothetical protein BZZ01_16210 [Nostocales cyanobacterium HT-58-2]